MIVELGNHAPLGGDTEQPCVTTINIPEFDDGSTHPDAEYKGPHPHDPEETGSLVTPGPSLGGYTHEIDGIDVPTFKEHLVDGVLSGQTVTQLPGQEILLSILHPAGAWVQQSASTPKWVKVYDHHDGITPDGQSADVEKFLAEYWKCPTAEEYFKTTDQDELYVKKELSYWTQTPPGELPPGVSLPSAEALFVNTGRVISNVNDGGGQVGAIGAGTAATATTLTTASTYSTNQWAGYRVVVYSTTSNNMVWGNVLSNTNAAGASVLTVDRWYVAATPGGSAGTTPTTPWGFMILDGGFVSTWFVGLATGANAPAAADTTLSTNGNAEIATAGGGLIRKIAPYAQTSGVASRAITLTPVYTANGSDSLPATVTTIGVFAGMVVGSAGIMKFETALTPSSATLSAVSDQLTVTETITGS